MANEISLTASLQLNKSGVSIGGTVSGLAITQAGTNNIGNVQAVGTSSEALSLVDVTTIGYLFLKNLSTTNFVSIGTINPAVAATCQVTLLPGEATVIPTRLAAWYGIADTASVDVLVVAFEL